MSSVALGWCLLLINQIFSSKYLPGHTLFLVNLCWGGPTCYEGCNFVAAIQTPLKWIDVQRCSINFMLRFKANEKEEVNKNRIWHSQRAILDSICTYCKVYEHEPLKYSKGQEKVKPQGSQRPVAVSHPKTIGGQCGQLGHFCLDKQPVPKIPTAPRSLILPPKKAPQTPKNLPK